MNLFDLLKEHAGMSREEAEHYFRIDNTATEWTMTSILYLEPTKFHAVLRLAKEYGGTYDSKPKGGIVHIPKEGPGSNPGSLEGRSDGKLEEALGHGPPSESLEGYALSRSLKGKLGQLVPCLADANGVIFDGLHRKQIDPNALTIRVDKVKTSVDRAAARMTVNFCRRDYTPEEMRADIGFLVGAGFSAQQIVDDYGVGLTTVYKYMPQEKKVQVKVEAGKVSGQVRSVPPAEHTVKTQDTAQPEISPRIQRETLSEKVECASCHMGFHISKATLVDDKYYCPQHASQAKPKGKPEFTKLPAMPTDSWTFRKAQMTPQHSSMEQAIHKKLSGKGLNVFTDFEFCLQKTTPDFWFPDQKLAVYIDGPVHVGREDRDEALRDLLRKRHGVNVVSIPYVADTEMERERVFNLITEETKA